MRIKKNILKDFEKSKVLKCCLAEQYKTVSFCFDRFCSRIYSKQDATYLRSSHLVCFCRCGATIK